MASMIGIGVAIDYSLFILARYREERDAGREPDDARAQALSTSGLAVTFSGLAVIVSLAGLWMVDNQALRSMALGAMTVVAVSILTATTLLPALIALLGDRVMPGGVVARVARLLQAQGLPPPASGRRRTGADLLGALGDAGHGPALDRGDRRQRACSSSSRSRCSRSQTGTEALGQFPKDSDVRVGNELASEQLGGGDRPDPDRRRPSTARPTAPRSPPSSASSRPPPASPRSRRPPTPTKASCSRRRRARRQRVRRRRRPGRPPARHGRPGLRARPGGDRRRRRRNRPRRRRPRPDQRLDVEDHPLRPRPQLPRPDGDAALDAAAAEGGADEPALDRRRLRRARRDLPVGLVRQPARLRKPGRARHDQRAADLRRSSSASRWTTRSS